LVPDQEPQLRWDAASGRLVLSAENVPSPRDEHSHYDTEVYLNLRDLELLRRQLAVGGGQTEQVAAPDAPRD
jgi:hypothetical protein